MREWIEYLQALAKAGQLQMIVWRARVKGEDSLDAGKEQPEGSKRRRDGGSPPGGNAGSTTWQGSKWSAQETGAGSKWSAESAACPASSPPTAWPVHGWERPRSPTGVHGWERPSSPTRQPSHAVSAASWSSWTPQAWSPAPTSGEHSIEGGLSGHGWWPAHDCGWSGN